MKSSTLCQRQAGLRQYRVTSISTAAWGDMVALVTMSHREGCGGMPVEVHRHSRVPNPGRCNTVCGYSAGCAGAVPGTYRWRAT